MKKLMQNRKFILIGLIVILVIVGTIAITTSFSKKEDKISSVEELKLKETSNKVISNIEEIENSESTEIDRYINYCLEKAYNEEGKTSLTEAEIKNIISTYFTLEVSEEQIESIGITPYMLTKNITYDFSTKTYTMNVVKLSYSDIASKEIIKYELNKVEKEGVKYIITYKKYLVKNPYEILNYYNDLNNKQNSPVIDEETGEIIEKNTEKEYYDTSEIMAYLKGEAKTSTIKKYITPENISEVGEEVGTIKITYVFRNDQILIDNISK